MTMTHSPNQNTNLFNPERMQNMDPTQVGDVGEHLVASIVGGYGYEVVKANGKGYDLLTLHEGKPIRIDVKTRSRHTPAMTFYVGKGKTTAYRDFTNENVDMFAFICLETLKLVFKPSADYIGLRSAYVPVSEWKDSDPYESWEQALSAIL